MDAKVTPHPANLPAIPPRRKAAPRNPAFWLAYWLAIALLITKMFHFGLPSLAHLGAFWIYTHDLLISSATDNLFALCLGIVAAASLRLLMRRPRALLVAQVSWTIAFALCALYAIINAFVFDAIKTPITKGLLVAAGDWRDMRSSLAPYFDQSTLGVLCSGPLAYLLIVWSFNRWLAVPRTRTASIVLVLLAGGVLAQCAYARSVQRQWMRRDDRRIAFNPHWVLFASIMFNSKAHFNVPSGIPDSYDSEFLPVRERDNGSRASYSVPFKGRPRHVIVYGLESVSTQFLHLYGSRFQTTPNLDAEAAYSLVLENVYCHVGRTPQSLVTLCTSNYARLNWDADVFDTHQPLIQPGISLAQVLKQHGFRTLGLSAANLGDFHQREFLEACGFDEVWDKRDLPGKDLTTWGKADGPMLDKLLGWIDRDPAHATPFFALCWTNQTHHPYALTPGQKSKEILGKDAPPQAAAADLNRYLNCLTETDRILERLMTALRVRGIADDTLLIIVGDHGEGFYWPHNTGYHGYRLFEENVHVPCVIWNPRLFSPGKRIATVAGHIDLCPTITDILGVDPAGTWQGHSLFDPARPSRAYFYAYYDDNLLGVRDGDWKYIYNSTTGFDELYNIALDPREQADVYAQHADICRELRWRVGAWTRYLDRHGAGVKP